jgi:hypothetical protein
MRYREVPIYDGRFATLDEIMTGDPAAPAFPRQAWREQIGPEEFAVRYKDFKTDQVQSAEICRIFSCIEDARANSLEIAERHPGMICILYDHTGTEVQRVENSKALKKFAVSVYSGILSWLIVATVGGMAILWCAYRLALFPVNKWWHGVIAPSHPLPLTGWIAFAGSGLVLTVALCLVKAWFIAKRRAEGLVQFHSGRDETFRADQHTSQNRGPCGTRVSHQAHQRVSRTRRQDTERIRIMSVAAYCSCCWVPSATMGVSPQPTRQGSSPPILIADRRPIEGRVGRSN